MSDTTQLTEHQKNFQADYEALRRATENAALVVVRLEELGQVTPGNPYGNLTGPQRALLDLAKEEHVRVHGQLTTFLRDTSTTLAREGQRLETIANDPNRSLSDRNEAGIMKDSVDAQYMDFLDLKASQGWIYPAPLEYQIGERRELSDRGGVRTFDSPTGTGSGFVSSVLQWWDNVNSASAADVQALKDLGIDFTDYDGCVKVLGMLTDAFLFGIPVPDVFKNSPKLPWGETVGETLWGEGQGSVFKANEETCKFIFKKGDNFNFLQKYGVVDEEFLNELDGLDVDTVTISVPTDMLATVVAMDSVLQKVPQLDSLEKIDLAVQNALSNVATTSGMSRVLSENLQEYALELVDGLTFGAGTFSRTEGNQLRINADIGGSNVVLLASLNLGTTSDAGNGFKVTGVESIDGDSLPYALDPQDLQAHGFDFTNLAAGTVPAGFSALIQGLSPTQIAANGWAAPAISETDIPQGFERRVELGNGWTAISQYDSDRRLVGVTETYAPNAFQSEILTYRANADGTRTLLTHGGRMVFHDGSYFGTETDVVNREVFSVTGDADGNTTRDINKDATQNLRNQDAATVFSDVNSVIAAIKGGQPIPLIAGGVRFVNTLNLQNGQPLGDLSAISNAAAGALSFYNLYNAFESDDDFAKVNSTLSTINYANIAINTSLNSAGQLVWASAGASSLNTFLNGPANGIAGGAVGVLPAIGLVASIKAEDPIGIAMSLGTMIQGAPFLTSNPIGWCLIAASIVRAILEEGPPDAWGVAKVTFGDGFNNLDPQVHASGENFGPDRVRQQLQGIVDVVSQIIDNNNQSTSDSSLWLGLIPQRMPGLTYRAKEFEDEGYAVSDIDPLTGAQRIPFVRFDDNGQPFGFVPDQLTAEERAMLALPGTDAPALVAYMLNSAMQREAIAPMWEVRTAKLQEQAGDPNAGLSEEERAAKAGLAAAVDTQYAASHTADPQAKNRRVGHFMPVAVDLSGDGRIDTRTIAQVEAAGQSITFDWDGQGYQKQTGWIGAGDAFLVLDKNFNQSVDQAEELLSNPLIADPGKGLRVLAAYDANQDGRIDANDPVYSQLKVWQDLDQDGNNTRALTLNGISQLAQDESNGLTELRSLQEVGITAIDYANGRIEMGDGNYRLIATQMLEAEDEGTQYTPVGAGIKIQVSNGAPQILVTQVLSEQAVYASLQIAASDETIGTPGAELYEDGVTTSYDPNTQGGPIELVINAAQLLQNDTWADVAGVQAGLAITGVRAGAHTSVSIRADGNISLRLEANYNGAAEFFYTVAVPGYETLIAPREARVGLNITPVNDAPTITNSYDADRPVFGYSPLAYRQVVTIGTGENVEFQSFGGTAAGAPIYTPYIEHIPPQPIFEYRYTGGENESWDWVQVGTTPGYDVERYTPIASEHPNRGSVLASDLEGGSFSYQVVSQGIYGTGSVSADGTWNYIGRRPSANKVPDINGDGQAEWVDPASGNVQTAYIGDPNVNSNSYIGAETAESFADYFTVRVYDNGDPSGQTFRDVQIQATHYGPAPLPVISDSGGKKPIAIDLDGDGFHFQDVDDSNVFFEVNGEGWKRRMAWTEPGDGLLAYDRDGNGKIDRSDEISFVPYAPGEQTDMKALAAAFDTNHDGRFDAQDANWSSFGVWHDANTNGITDSGEFRTLGEMGITSIDMSTDGQFRVIDGQTVHGIGSAHLSSGGSVAVADVTLRYSNETRVITANPDGTTTTSTVITPATSQGQDFEGTADKDLVFGTKGSDRFRMAEGDDVVVDDGGNDVVDASDGDDQVFTGIDNDVVYGGNGNDSIYTGAGNDLVFGDGAGETGDDLIMLEDGNDIAFGAAGNDFISGGLGNDVLSGNLGDDKLFGESGWDVLFGQEGDDELYGMDGNDMLDGAEGNDLLAGGAGDDSMEGGAGDDSYEVDSAGDAVVETSGGGHDTVIASITYSLGAEVEDLRLVGEAAINGTGNAADNLLVGNDRANTLAGLAGNDALDGGLGGDTMIGGMGDDTYYVESSSDVVVEATGEGTDTVRSRVSRALEANVENLTLIGSAAIDGTGNVLHNVIVGNISANVLDGGAGGDLMRGGRGDDTYIVDDAADVVVEQPGEGTDTVIASVSYGLSANVENLVLTGNAVQGTGNELGNVITGNALGNVLDGGAGGDTLAGGAGDDAYVVEDANDLVVENAGEGSDTVRASIDQTLAANVENLVLTGGAVQGTGNELGNVIAGNALGNVLDGGAGGDTLAGGAGDDTYVVEDASDLVVENADEGSDTVRASIDQALAANVENLVLTGGAVQGTGNALDNTLTGNAGNNVLDGGAGGDRMVGGTGDDTYMVDNAADVVVEQPGEGTDTVIASVSYGLSANVENLTLTGSAVQGTGNELGNVITGNALGNVLDGGAGGDTLAGGAGDDTYLVDDAADVVVEQPGEGRDTVIASVSYGLSANVENLTLTGNAVQGTGNGLGNVITGNALGNVLDGGAGGDTLAGGAGDDAYVVEDANDLVVENAGEGSDTVRASIDQTLAANVESLVLTGIAVRGIGNALDNTLTGNAAGNLLDGGAGGDRMVGGAGDDTYMVDNAADVVVEQPGEGTDTVIASVSYGLSANVENLTLTGNAVQGTGNELGNILIGNGEANVLDGGVGVDQMAAGVGDDTYIVDDAGDTVTEHAGEGKDTVATSVSYTLSANVENLVLVGSADLAGKGNELANALQGNAGANLLDGGSGADTMVGGAGDDTYVVDDIGDTVVEQPDEGKDTVRASVTYTLADNVEDLTLTGTADVAGYGNTLDNLLTGNSGANFLDGGAGGDLMQGGASDDTYVVDDVRDAVIEWFASGNDTVLSGIDYVLPQNLEKLRLTGVAVAGTGNGLENTILGNALDNLLDGGAGADQMEGGAGSDTYVVDDAGDTTIEHAGEGTDHVIASVSYALADAVENLTLVGSANIDASGNSLDNAIEGNAGNNLIDGGSGADVMAGSAGDDTYIVDDGADTVVEGASEGQDTIRSSVSYTLSDNVEALVLTGTAIWGAGNDLDNLLNGNLMDNLIDGGAGADQMTGGAGNDTYIVDSAGDTVVEAVSEGVDTVRSSVSYTLSGNVEDLVLTGADDIAGSGNALDNVIAGNSGDNLLAGGAGNDVYVYSSVGGLDTIVDTEGVDTVRFGTGLTIDNVALRIAFVGTEKIAQIRVLDANGNEQPDQGIDYLMQSDAQNRLTSPIESFVFADGSRYEWSDLLIQSTSLTGTRDSDILVGGRNDDALDGGWGRDAMYGGSGHDTMYGQDGNDILYGFGGNDKLYGGNDNDELYGEAGDDQLFGENGNDYLLDLKGSNIFYSGNHSDVVQGGAGSDRLETGNDADVADAGAGSDVVFAGGGDDWVAAGKGNDSLDTGSGRNLVAFNRGDGVDTLVSGGRDMLSLGGGIRYADLRLTKSGNDLVVGVGQGESIALKDWYQGAKTKPVDTLQVITVGGDYDGASPDKTRNRQVEVFDFTRIVQAFDVARAANATNASGWALMNSMLDAHLQGSDTAALGGDLSFQYATTGSLAGIGLGAAQAAAAAGVSNLQLLHARSELEAGPVKLC
jgi:Ca2+-binding RTX toxin-like protein